MNGTTQTALADLILRPSTLKPGTYETEDKRAFVVVEHHGRSYEMIWCHSGESHKIARPGDTVFERAFIRDHKVVYPPNNGVIETVPVESYPVDVLKVATPPPKKKKAASKARRTEPSKKRRPKR